MNSQYEVTARHQNDSRPHCPFTNICVKCECFEWNPMDSAAQNRQASAQLSISPTLLDLYIYLLKVKFRTVNSWVNIYIYIYIIHESYGTVFKNLFNSHMSKQANQQQKNKVQVNLSASRPFYCSFKPSDHPSSRPGLFHRGMWRNLLSVSSFF